MEVIFLILIFIAPGLAIKLLGEALSKRERQDKPRNTVYENLFTVGSLSVFATIITCGILNAYRKKKKLDLITSISMLVESMDRFDFLLSYGVILIGVTILVGLFYKLLSYFWDCLKRYRMKENYGLSPMSPDGRSVWEETFLNSEKNSAPRIVSIFMGGNYITSGYLNGWNFASYERKEFEVVRSQEIEKILKDDKDKKPAEKLLSYIEEEYFDMETGILIRFYDSSYVNEHWEEIDC